VRRASDVIARAHADLVQAVTVIGVVCGRRW
jgi:hypothetical protein